MVIKNEMGIPLKNPIIFSHEMYRHTNLQGCL